MENLSVAEQIVYIINQVGFPIAVSIFCAWYMTNTGKQMSNAMQTLTDSVNKLVVIVETFHSKGGE